MSSPVSPCICTRRGLWACSNGNGSASSWRTCGSQQPRESVWSPRLVGYLACCKMPGSHLQSSERRGFPLQTFSMMLQHSSACYTQGPISTCSLQPVMIGSDAHISWGLLSTTFGLGLDPSPVLYFSLLPCCFRLMVILQMHIYMAWRFVVAALECWAKLWLFLDLDSDFSCCYCFFSSCFTGTCSVLFCV